eukprot:Blabericola_migrator_1__5082@NODE_262_length_10689_cov_220_487008_g219_i0_p2_GENE_NODE_262_length_10689_cov_220_487008_g219_i0NODE_262_length_10689_cov_220_487008_g219_i0_p2_ORF_typecomplete_len820_score99_46Treacle/PF03546_14/0_13Treacle/PF03546_14/8_3e03_NODE_262_length_10689_cov_220_487008_g219_i0811810577
MDSDSYNILVTPADSPSIQQAVLEGRAFLIERPTAEDLKRNGQVNRRCGCVAFNRPVWEDYVAPFMPPQCTWAQKPIRQLPLIPAQGIIPPSLLEEEEAYLQTQAAKAVKELADVPVTTPAQSVPAPAVPAIAPAKQMTAPNTETLPYKLSAPVIIAFVMVLLAACVARQIRVWWIAKQTQIRFEKLLQSTTMDESHAPNIMKKASTGSKKRLSRREVSHPPAQKEETLIVSPGRARIKAVCHKLMLQIKRLKDMVKVWQSSEVRDEFTTILRAFISDFFITPLHILLQHIKAGLSHVRLPRVVIETAEEKKSVEQRNGRRRSRRRSSCAVPPSTSSEHTLCLIGEGDLHKRPINKAVETSGSTQLSSSELGTLTGNCNVSQERVATKQPVNGFVSRSDSGTRSVTTSDDDTPVFKAPPRSILCHEPFPDTLPVSSLPRKPKLGRLQAIVLSIESTELQSRGSQTMESPKQVLASTQTTSPRRVELRRSKAHNIVTLYREPSIRRVYSKCLLEPLHLKPPPPCVDPELTKLRRYLMRRSGQTVSMSSANNTAPVSSGRRSGPSFGRGRRKMRLRQRHRAAITKFALPHEIRAILDRALPAATAAACHSATSFLSVEGGLKSAVSQEHLADGLSGLSMRSMRLRSPLMASIGSSPVHSDPAPVLLPWPQHEEFADGDGTGKATLEPPPGFEKVLHHGVKQDPLTSTIRKTTAATSSGSLTPLTTPTTTLGVDAETPVCRTKVEASPTSELLKECFEYPRFVAPPRFEVEADFSRQLSPKKLLASGSDATSAGSSLPLFSAIPQSTLFGHRHSHNTVENIP